MPFVTFADPKYTTPSPKKKSSASLQGSGPKGSNPRALFSEPKSATKKEKSKSDPVDDLCNLFRTKITIEDKTGLLSPKTRGFKYFSPFPKEGGRYIDIIEVKPGVLSPVKRCARFRSDA